MEPLVTKLQEALQKHYWTRLGQTENIELSPFNSMVDYVFASWNAKLDKKESCALAGSKLLGSVLVMTNRRWASSVEEANELFLVGMDVASYLWDELDKEKRNFSAFREKLGKMTAFLQNEFKSVRQ